MSTATIRKPNSRENRDPKYTKTDKPKEAVATARDKAIWQRIFIDCGYPLVRLDVLHAFMGKDGGNYESLEKHYNILSREPNCYVYRHPEQWDRRGYGRSTVYGLDRKGFEALGLEAQSPVAKDKFEHDFMWCEYIQNVHLGALKHGRPFAGKSEILNSEHCPPETRNLAKPFELPVVRHKFEGTTEADGPAFGVANEAGSFWRFFFVQADRDTMGITSKDDKRSSLDRHFRDAFYVIRNGVAQKQLGLPEGEIYFIFICPSLTHLRNAKEHLEDITSANNMRWLREYILFHDFPTFKSEQRPTTTSGDMFTTLYDRVQSPPFSFSKLEA